MNNVRGIFFRFPSKFLSTGPVLLQVHATAQAAGKLVFLSKFVWNPKVFSESLSTVVEFHTMTASVVSISYIFLSFIILHPPNSCAAHFPTFCSPPFFIVYRLRGQ
jgi:hypothetical protein